MIASWPSRRGIARAFLDRLAALQLLSDGLVAWRTNHLAQPDASLFGDLAGMLLPEGTYRLFLMVTPAGDVTRNFVWETYFEITHTGTLDPFAPP